MGYCKVLGSIRAFDAEGEELALVSESQRRLLAMLCLHSRTVVRSVVPDYEASRATLRDDALPVFD